MQIIIQIQLRTVLKRYALRWLINRKFESLNALTDTCLKPVVFTCEHFSPHLTT